jgi:pimeloyl-ACP methyl ester carboxylesterase
MAKSTRLFKSFFRLVLPVVLLVVAAVAAGSVWLVYSTAHPVTARYLFTPDKYGQLSTRAAQVTEETWTNLDGSSTRAWLLRGAENAPAVILLHKYGADRSYVLNLGVKLNESTNFTVLMPDQRGHGENPTVPNASFGGCESEDVTVGVQFLRSLKDQNLKTLVGKDIGAYGIEMGAIAALSAAVREPSLTAIALDSVPDAADSVLIGSINRRYPFATAATSRLAKMGTHLYYFDGCYKREPLCETAAKLENRSVLLLAGFDAHEFQDSTGKLNKCFSTSNTVESKTDLSPSGFSIMNASLEQSGSYEQRVIDFFRNALRN